MAAFAACATQPDVLPGERNAALAASAERHGLPLEWLTAVGYQQGRFELPGSDDAIAAPPNEPDDVLADDTPADDDGVAMTDDGAPDGDDSTGPQPWGVMYLSADQVEQAASLAHLDPAAIRTDIATNIEAAAALLADGWDRRGRSPTALRDATAELEGVGDDAEAAGLALADVDATLATGFDLTTLDGERLVLAGTGATPADAEPIEKIAPGHYPPRQWIPSPNHSSRQGLAVRYIVIHDIEGRASTAISIFKKSANQVSAHYVLRASDGHVVQMVVESQNAWHAGHGWFNRHSVGIEHEGFAFKNNGGGFYTDTQYQSSARLACAIAHRYNIPVDRKHIFGHMNVPSNLASHTLCSDARGIAGHCGGVSHHADPGRFWNWTKYMHLVRTCVAAAG